MKEKTEPSRDRLPCGMVSLKMFKINHSKALVIAYLNLRGGLKKYTFNQTDIIKQTDIGKTVVRQCLKELVAEGVLNRKGISFYKLNRQRMEELYYEASDSDSIRSDSDSDRSENDPNRSESDLSRSENGAIHSSRLQSSKIDSSSLKSSNLHTTGNFNGQPSEQASSFSSSAELPNNKIQTVTGTSPKPSKKSYEEQFKEFFGVSLYEEGKAQITATIITEELFDDIFGSVPSEKNKTLDISESAAFPSDNPVPPPKVTDTHKDSIDSSDRPAVAAKTNLPIPSGRPGKVGGLTDAAPKRSAVDELLSLPPTEQVKWLEAVEANESMERDLKSGKDVLMTEAFKDYFANM